jgi:hypothetical protein
MARTDTIRTTASVDGRPLGEFDTFSGGDPSAEDVKHARGAGGVERSRGGRQTVDNVTIGREYDTDIDLHWLAARRGKPGLMTVTRQPLDDDYNPKGRPLVYTGTLIKITPSDEDANGNAIDMFQLEMSCDGNVS